MPVVASPGAIVHTVSDLIEDTFSHLLGMDAANYNRLASSISSISQENIVLELDLESVQPGSVISIDTEDILVLAVNDSSKTITKCVRGFRGSEETIHAANAVVHVNPRFTRYRVLRALRDEIYSWSPKLYRVSAVDISLTATTHAFDLAGLPIDYLHVIQTWIEPSNSYEQWKKISHRVGTNMATSDFASTNAIFFPAIYSGRTVRVQYAHRFDLTNFTGANDAVAGIGLASSMVDIPPLGAAFRLLAPREAQRSDFQAQGQSRRAEEVPPGSTFQAAAGLKQMRDMRINEEALSLLHRYGIRNGL